MEVKICGVRDLQAAAVAVEAGAAAIGLVFAESPRRIDPIAAARIVSRLPSDVAAVAVFRHPSRAELLEVLDAVPVDFVQSEPGPATRVAQEAGVRLLPVVHDGPDVVGACPTDEPGVKSAGRIRAFIREAQAAGADPAASAAGGAPVFHVTRYSR